MPDEIKPEVDLSKADFLKNQLSKEPGDSKKWRMAKIGLYGIAFFFVVGVLTFFLIPSVAAHVVVLTQIAIGAWTSIVGIYLGAQGSVDFKTTQALSSAVEKRDEHITKDEHQVIEHVYHEGDEGSPELKPWGQDATEDHDES